MRFLQNFRFTSTVKNLCALSLISIFLFAGVVMAKDFWETKPFDQWSQKECQKMLTDSPWAKELELVGRNVEMGSSAVSTDSRAPYIKYTAQLRSAAPLRQAVVRQLQIVNKYDSLPDDQKQAFSQNTDSFLLGPPSEFVVVNIQYESNIVDHNRDLNRYWETQTTDVLKNSVYLSGSKGVKVPLSQFVPGAVNSQEFQFVFPREVDGKEILKPGDKALQLEFAYPVIKYQGYDLGDGRAFIEFKADKIKINNEFIY